MFEIKLSAQRDFLTGMVHRPGLYVEMESQKFTKENILLTREKWLAGIAGHALLLLNFFH